jgi:hypothetical protein
MSNSTEYLDCVVIDALRAFLADWPNGTLAKHLGVDSANISNAVNAGYFAPVLLDAMVCRGMIVIVPEPPTFYRFAARMPLEMHAEIAGLMRDLGIGSNAEFLMTAVRLMRKNKSR